MSRIAVLVVLFLVGTPYSVSALSFSFDDFPPACELEGRVVSVKFQPELSPDLGRGIWTELSHPDRYVVSLEVLRRINPDLKNPAGTSCARLYKKGKEMQFHLSEEAVQEKAVELEVGMFLGGTVYSATNGVWLGEHYSVASIEPDESPVLPWVVGALIAGFVTGVFIMRFKKQRVDHT